MIAMLPPRTSEKAVEQNEREIYHMLNQELFEKDRFNQVTDSIRLESMVEGNCSFSTLGASETSDFWGEDSHILLQKSFHVLMGLSVSSLPTLLFAACQSRDADAQSIASVPIAPHAKNKKKKTVHFGTTKVYEHGLVVGNQATDCPLQLDWVASQDVTEIPAEDYADFSRFKGIGRRPAPAKRLSSRQRRERLACVYDLDCDQVRRLEAMQRKQSSLLQSCSSIGRWENGAIADAPPTVKKRQQQNM